MLRGEDTFKKHILFLLLLLIAQSISGMEPLSFWVDNEYKVPALKPGHVRIGVAAASVNFADPLTVQGTYQVKMPLPFVPGSEGSGIILEVGRGVSSYKPGDKVVFFHQGGAFAEEVVVHGSVVWRVPDAADLQAAAAVPVTYGTADVALRHRCQLQKGQTVLVLGASGGVGVAAVQIAKVQGAQVIAVTQGQDKVEFLKSQGADVVLDLANTSKETPLNALIKQHAPRGVHVVIDPVGGQLFNEALKSIAWGGHIAVIGFAAGGIPKIPANILLVKNTTVHGLFWGSYLQHNPQVLRQSMDEIFQWLAAGLIRPHVSHRFPLEQTPDAFKTLWERKAMGKILITPGHRGNHTSKL